MGVGGDRHECVRKCPKADENPVVVNTEESCARRHA
jgi:hypothetical protein